MGGDAVVSPKYDRDNARQYTVTRTGIDPPSSNWSIIQCPWCSALDKAYWWSISGGGKKCSGCGAMHNSAGYSAQRIKEPKPMKTYATKKSAIAAIKKAGLDRVPYELQTVQFRQGSARKTKNGITASMSTVRKWKPVFKCELDEDVIELRSRGFEAERVEVPAGD